MKKKKLKSSSNIVYECSYHVVWCTKYRRPVLSEERILARIKHLLAEVSLKTKSAIIEMEIMPDHIHLLVNVHPQFGIHKLVKHLKGYSSRILRQEFPSLKSRLPTLWTNSYCVLTTGGATIAKIKKYIENQKNK